WATRVHTEGEQAQLIKGKAGEKEQAIYYQQFKDWTQKEKVCTFFFEAFDEPWKGGPHPNEVEKHWGLFKVDRQPKEAMKSFVK
ncbi:MAG: glycosyl hydrolase family 17 protein, partial [Lacipirellulaceae bacterium]